MARWEPEQTVTQSVLERLIDRDPANSSDAAVTRAQSVRQLKSSLRRDLEWLLNSRRTPEAVGREFQELEQSLYNFGLPDATSLSWDSARDRSRLARMIEQTLATFEPRLRSVRVVSVDATAAAQHVMRFQIEGMLEMDPTPEHISFDTVLQLSSGEYQVKGIWVRDDLLLYYERELTFLRQMGAEFAAKYPKVASRLVLEPDKCEDPHVERMLEAFAFLTARVHLKIDDEFPEITEALLNILHPHYLRPIPSMTVAEFHMDAAQAVPEAGLKLDRGAVLNSRPVNGVPCKFRTCYDLTFWPLEVTEAEWKTPDRLQPPVKSSEAVAAVRIGLRCPGELKFAKLGLSSLRFYLNGESNLVHTLYELLCNNCSHIVIRDTSPKSRVQPVILGADALRPAGFGEDDGMLPYTRRSFVGYRLLQEYFCFPQKFFFLDLTELERICEAGFGGQAEVILMISPFERGERRQMLELGVSAKTFRLNCAPLVNLFQQTAEPILLDHTAYEYPVVPDVSRRRATEVFEITDVQSANPQSGEVVQFEPFYSYRHGVSRSKVQAFWRASRRASGYRDDEGTEVFLSLVDLSLRPVRPNVDALVVRTVCTNRDLPARLPFGNEAGDFELEGALPVKRIVALIKPTDALRPPVGKDSMWRMVSQLSLNYLSLVENGREALQEILRLYNFTGSTYSEKQIEGLAALDSRRHFARVISEDGVVFARGTRVEMEFDEDQFVGGGVYLFASVLEYFLGLYVSMNSFSQLRVRTRQRKEILRQWPPRAGRKILL